MLPNFLVIGAQKAASSWLVACLSEHPDVLMVAHRELHYFNANWAKGLRWYEGQFSHWSGQKAVGEKSTMYLSDPAVPARILKVLGSQVRLIVNLRHPVDRAYSAYWHSMRDGRIPSWTSFAAALENFPDLRINSMYGRHLGRYLDVFPRSNILALIVEEMGDHRDKVLEKTFQFLDVESGYRLASVQRVVNEAREVRLLSRQMWNLSRLANRLPRGVRNSAKYIGRKTFNALPVRRAYQPLPEGDRLALLADFVPDIQKLESLLDVDLRVWWQAP